MFYFKEQFIALRRNGWSSSRNLVSFRLRCCCFGENRTRRREKVLVSAKKGAIRPVHSTPPSNNQRVTTCPSSRHAGFVISLSTSCVFLFPFPAPFTSRRTQFVTCRTLDNRHVYSFHSDSSNLRAASPTGNGTSFEHFSEQPDLMD